MRFAAGFLTASAIAGGLWFFWLRPPDQVLAPPAPIVAAAPEPEAPSKAKKRRGGRRGSAASAGNGPAETFDDRGISDDLTPGGFELDAEAEGGERPISNDQVEATINRGWSRIQRCILLDAAERETPARGTVRLGIRIRPNGSVAAVTADAPGDLRGGTVVPCLRTTVSSLRFPAFEGREAVVSYPIRIE